MDSKLLEVIEWKQNNYNKEKEVNIYEIKCVTTKTVHTVR